MEINNFKDMYLAELQELVSVESHLADALLRMAGAAAHPALKDLLIHHRAETETQKQRHIPTRPCRLSSKKQGNCLAC